MLLRAFKTGAATALLSAALQGCAITDSVDHRADIMNESTARFRNQVILRNIVRSAHDEPLNFTTINNITGHNTVNLSIPGIPGFTWGTPPSAANAAGKIIPGIEVLRSSNSQTSESYNFASDFNFNVADDPATYAAFLSPLDAATMASFVQNSAYRSAFLYLLLVDKIRVARKDGQIIAEFRSQWIYQVGKPGVPGDLSTDWADANWNAYRKLAAKGLVFQAQRGSLAGQGSKKTPSQVCFDRRIYEIYEKQGRYPAWESLASNKGDRPAGKLSLPKKDVTTQPGVAPKPGAKPKVQRIMFCDEDNSWLPAAGDSAGTTNIACAYAVADSQSAAEAKNCGKGAQIPKDAASYIVFDKDEEIWIEIYTRSTWGVYQVLGAWTNDVAAANAPRRDLDGEVLFTITKDGDDCFVEVTDREHYCVPNGKDSRRTRIIFTILHQLAGLQSTAAASQPTQSVRTVP
jgi:hypothetical protein